MRTSPLLLPFGIETGENFFQEFHLIADTTKIVKEISHPTMMSISHFPLQSFGFGKMKIKISKNSTWLRMRRSADEFTSSTIFVNSNWRDIYHWACSSLPVQENLILEEGLQGFKLASWFFYHCWFSTLGTNCKAISFWFMCFPICVWAGDDIITC